MSFAPPNILLLSGYHAASHQYWCDQLVGGLPEFNWTQVALPDRHFYWRIRSNALSFAFQYPQLRTQKYDLVVATSMVDVCNLRGLLPHLSRVPIVLYFHENQFAYPERRPDSDRTRNSTGVKQNSNLINAQLTTVYSALASDRLVFNSEYNRESFLEGARRLFAKMPDGTPDSLLDQLPEKSLVIPVPLSGELAAAKREKNNTQHNTPRDRATNIVWNHRWEYDKQPQVFFAAIEKLIANGYKLSVHVMGQSFREVPGCFSNFHNNHADVVSTWGHQPVEIYRQVLDASDIVVSAALHDFQGLGMLEAITAGCIPVAPDRMAYPEYMPRELLYQPDPVEELEVHALYEKLVQVIEGGIDDGVMRDIDVSQYANSVVLPMYQQFFSSLV